MDRKIAVVGLGYVGLPVAVAFGQAHPVVGFDIKAARIAELKAGRDSTEEVAPADLARADILFTDSVDELRSADFFIVAVPTPVDSGNKPDLSPLVGASRSVGKALKKGDIVVYESTVYPGATEEDCIPVLEQVSGLKFGTDFTVGYSPERINPGDREHTFTKIKKIVSGSDARTLDVVAGVYGSVVTAGVHRASSIKVAEAAKVIENTQRDLNIALMNELAVVFKRMGIDTLEVLEAAGSKWNFIHSRPGLVGGHCIGVDPYYLTHKAEQLGYIPQVILAGRRINDNMGRFVAHSTIKLMLRNSQDVPRCRVGVLGITFKENCPDIRNSKVADVVRELRDWGAEVVVHDPHADPHEVQEEYGIALGRIDAQNPVDALIVAVAHREFKAMRPAELRALVRCERPVLADVKSIFPRAELEAAGFTVWRL
ncbi:nucleotide sugar dehydrogenase [Ramlibacter tataouinensis]|uniref:nucleotide sugar dehydrogenase n=1 Tax=Ramlibacter tataouinensis TaxID=94132 RepID=UPI0022F38C51|nr:nucleotide sugar dehydrogenase [Ramlibacter tataouinensis]WBY00702.1 nucleotide sugar dehydrogenase [Ramlibacter tataouinensis]